MMSLNMKLGFIAILLVIIGFLSGWLGCLFFGNLAGSVRVLFVSEEALVALGTGVKNEGIWDIGIKNC